VWRLFQDRLGAVFALLPSLKLVNEDDVFKFNE